MSDLPIKTLPSLPFDRHQGISFGTDCLSIVVYWSPTQHLYLVAGNSPQNHVSGSHNKIKESLIFSLS